MSKPFRYILAVFAGAVAAVLVVWAVQSVGHAIYPLPEGLDPRDTDTIAAYVETAPAGALVFPLFAWIAGTFVGGLVASYVARSRPSVFAGIVGALMLISSVANMIMIPHPTWFLIATIVLIPAAAYGASRFATRSFGPPTAGSSQPANTA